MVVDFEVGVLFGPFVIEHGNRANFHFEGLITLHIFGLNFVLIGNSGPQRARITDPTLTSKTPTQHFLIFLFLFLNDFIKCLLDL